MKMNLSSNCLILPPILMQLCICQHPVPPIGISKIISYPLENPPFPFLPLPLNLSELHQLIHHLLIFVHQISGVALLISPLHSSTSPPETNLIGRYLHKHCASLLKPPLRFKHHMLLFITKERKGEKFKLVLFGLPFPRHQSIFSYFSFQ
uniref:Uncharacterized protein n=1 Tax=Nelumbo nucifera TaxID=4432 RepID=A0A822ZQ41_NELNU|nr:TPA_asm: hypothetical protein HUJ06_016537 [Nelumbo nucifera]